MHVMYCDFCGEEISKEKNNFGISTDVRIRDRKIFSKHIQKRYICTDVCADCSGKMLEFLDEIEAYKELCKTSNYVKTLNS